jgi:two-component system response regulator PilR (NtrC family)
MDTLRGLTELASTVACSVVIMGETGTGKNLVARRIHEVSRGRGPLVQVACPALSNEVVDWRSLLSQARGGSLLLDVVSDLSLPDQDALLNALRPEAGDPQSPAGQVRLLSTTRLDLEPLTRAGRFRDALYLRLASLVIHLPPLRTRLTDLPELMDSIVAKASEGGLLPSGRRPRFTQRALAALAAHPWRGNIRELDNVIQRTLIGSSSTSAGESIDEDVVLSALHPVFALR